MKERKISFEIKILDNMIERKIFKGVDKRNLTNKDKVIHQSDIEKEMLLRRSTISGILNTMEKNNLIKRSNSEVDARKKKIALTSYSLNKHKEIEKKIADFEKNLLKGISIKEKQNFIKIIDKLKENLK